eukprot:1452754-Amphidinium_carterae.1
MQSKARSEKKYYVRMVEFLPGEVIAKMEHTPDLLHAIGSAMGSACTWGRKKGTRDFRKSSQVLC